MNAVPQKRKLKRELKPKPKPAKARRIVDPNDTRRANEILLEHIPAEVNEAFKNYAKNIDLGPFANIWAQFESKRLQCTYSTKGCKYKTYDFSRRAFPIQQVDPETNPDMYALIVYFADRVGVPKANVIAHANLYPEGTGAGISPHQDNEPILNPAYPIFGLSDGGPATLCIWHGSVKDIGDRKPAEIIIEEGVMYIMQAGFQQTATHSITRKRKGMQAQRISLTIRVVY